MAERNCKKCFHYKACKEVASHSGYGDIYYTESQCKNFIPTADVVEVKHGEWKQVSGKYPRYVCTSCNHLYNNKEYKYCPFCGAKMDGESRGG